MSREIKFRAWNGKKMRGIDKNDFFSIRNDGQLSIQLPDPDFEIPLMQFTGLKDKYGVDIYEGDIVFQFVEYNDTEYFDGGYESSEPCEFEYRGVVYITASKGAVINKTKKRDVISCDDVWVKTWSTSVRGCRAKVIGNIYENPELIK